MKDFKKIMNKFAISLALLLVASVIGLGGTVEARTKYNPNGTATSATPVFNEFYDVPNGVGDEADFVRVKPKAGGNGDYVSTLNDACNVGSSFNVRTYVHNGADPSQNKNGSGSAVAHNVVVRMTAPLNKAQKNFTFNSTISASNAASVSDSALLNCNGNTVKLSLVPSSVQTYSKPIGFKTVPDSAVNGSLKIGSQSQGSGDVWACWDDRVIVTFEVIVEKVPVVPPVSTAVCKLDNGAFVVTDDRKVTVKVNATVKNATVVGYQINWGDGSAVSNKQTDTHQYPTDKDGTYDIQARVKVKLADGSEKWVDGVDCAKTVKFTSNQPPVVPPVTPTVVVPPSGQLPDTGMNVFGIFATVSMIGAFLHKAYKARKATV